MLSGSRPAHVGYAPRPAGGLAEKFGDVQIHGLLIKAAGQDEFQIPREIGKVYGSAIKAMAEDQYARSPYATLKHALLIITRSTLFANSYQRTGGEWHADDMSEMKRQLSGYATVTDKIPAHTYLVSDFAPTMVQSEPVENAYHLFYDQRDVTQRMQNSIRTLDPYEIVLMNDYVWHRAQRAPENGVRNFVIVMFVPTQTMEKLIPCGPRP
jgi:hypothetical protein